MTTYYEYGVNLTDNQKRSLASAMNNRSPLTLRLKHSNLSGNDELMLTTTQLKRIQKSLANGTGADIKISKTQIRKVAKQGGSLFTTLASLGARVLPYAVKGLSKAVPALATGAVSALGSLGIDKLFGKGINIPQKFFPRLPMIVNELTQSQIDQINKTMQTGGRLVIKPTRKQVEGGFLGTLASVVVIMFLLDQNFSLIFQKNSHSPLSFRSLITRLSRSLFHSFRSLAIARSLNSRSFLKNKRKKFFSRRNIITTTLLLQHFNKNTLHGIIL